LKRAGKNDSAPELALVAARWRQGRARETVALLEALPGEIQAQPAAAFWRALAEADLGNKSLFRNALGTVRRSGLSAEETALLRAAAAKLKVELPAN
jgi:hypothetical protein